MRAKGYSATYVGRVLAGEPGFDWSLFYRNRLVAEGWTRGRRGNAEAEVREAINAREALHDAARKVA